MAYAPGISDKDEFGDIKKIQPGQLLDYVIQKHDAVRRGTHYDLRIGNPTMGMFSWAMNDALPTKEKDKQYAARTHLHDYDYNTFEGTIPSGYGAGKVKKHEDGKVLITHTTDNTISFAVANKKHPQRYTMVNPGQMGHGKVWIVVREGTPDNPGAEKLHYKSIPVNQLEEKLKSMAPGWNTQVKLDGALQFLNISSRGKAEMLSHRYSKTTGKPVIQTERFFGKIPHWDKLPKDIKNSVLYTEVHGRYDNGKIIPVQELGGLLNSSVSKSLTDQKKKGINLQAILFDIKRKGGKEYDTNVPYMERRKALQDVVKHLPKDKFVLPRMFDDLDGSVALAKRIQEGKEPDSVEGIVVHPNAGTPYKSKIRPEYDVFIRDIFPGEGKYKDTHAGGFTYSHTVDGPIVGRLGTGLSDETRKMMHENPDWFINRYARVAAHEKGESGALRVPSFLALHEDYPSPLKGPGADWMRKKINLIAKKKEMDKQANFATLMQKLTKKVLQHKANNRQNQFPVRPPLVTPLQVPNPVLGPVLPRP